MCIHKTDAGACAKYSDRHVVSYCVEGPCPDDTPTNAERIRAMSDVDLAMALMYPGVMGIVNIPCDHEESGYCCSCLLDWLQQPAEEG